ncbi:MAG: hypothetical protein U1A78_30465 [Polyangia bacterium]
MDQSNEPDDFDELSERLRQLRRQHQASAPQRRFRVPQELRPQLLVAVQVRRQRGCTLRLLALRLGIPLTTLAGWLQSEAPRSAPAGALASSDTDPPPAAALRPVLLLSPGDAPDGSPDSALAPSLSLRSPAGYLLQGLSLAQALELLRSLG